MKRALLLFLAASAFGQVMPDALNYRLPIRFQVQARLMSWNTAGGVVAKSWVQNPTLGAIANSNTVSQSFASLPTIGNYVFAACNQLTTSGVITMADNQGHTYTSTKSIVALSETLTLFRVKVTASSGTFTMTCNSTVSTFIAITIGEAAGLDPSSPDDGTPSSSSTAGSTTVNCGSVTTTNASDLLIAVGGVVNGVTTWTAGASYTLRGNTNISQGTSMNLGMETRIVSVTNTYSPTLTIDSALNNVCVAAAFK